VIIKTVIAKINPDYSITVCT